MKVLKAFLESGTIGEAAEELGCDQSALCKAVFRELDELEPNRLIFPRTLQRVKAMSYHVKTLIAREEAKLKKQQEQRAALQRKTRYILVRYPESIEMMKKFPNEAILVMDSASVLSIMLPEHCL